MNLLPKNQAKEGKEREQRVAAELSIKYEKEVNTRKEQLNELNDRYSSQTASLAHGFEEFRTAIATRKSVLEKEIQEFEERRAKALEPTRKIEEAALKLQLDNQERAAQLTAEEQSLAISKSQVLDSLMAVEEMRDKNTSKKIELDVREDGIKRQEEFLLSSQEELTKKWTDFHQSINNKMQEFSEKEQSLLAERHSLEVLKSENFKDKEDNTKERILLADERKTLERALQRLKK